jgi:hypothetical protein
MRLPEPALPPRLTPNDFLLTGSGGCDVLQTAARQADDHESNRECTRDLLRDHLRRRSRHIRAGVIAELIHPAVATVYARAGARHVGLHVQSPKRQQRIDGHTFPGESPEGLKSTYQPLWPVQSTVLLLVERVELPASVIVCCVRLPLVRRLPRLVPVSLNA